MKMENKMYIWSEITDSLPKNLPVMVVKGDTFDVPSESGDKLLKNILQSIEDDRIAKQGPLQYFKTIIPDDETWKKYFKD
jgi:hypothetical protein